MNNYTTNTYELKRNIVNLLNVFCENSDYYFAQRKAVYDLTYGVMKSKSLLISEIARALNEPISIHSVITRLDRHILDERFTVDLFSKGYVDLVKSMLGDDIVVLVDDTDIIKKYGQKFEDLDFVRDGSSSNKITQKGYTVTEMVALSEKHKQPITICSEIFSSKSKGFKSRKEVLEQLIKKVVKCYGNKVTFVFDRGFDDRKLNALLESLEVKYIIRIKDNRKFIYQNKKINSMRLKAQCKGKISIMFKNSNDEKYNLKISHLKVRLISKSKIEAKVVVVHGFSDSAMSLLTNIDIKGKEDVKRVFWLYMKRWKIEEMFRYMKVEFSYEKCRVRTIQGMQKMINIVHLINMIMVKIKENERSSLYQKIITRARVLRDDVKRKVSFYLYQISNGIVEILSKSQTSLDKYLKRETKIKYRQLQLELKY